ncbi:MAG: enoyl-CoA hydratase/isomerase family protein [Chitinophagales bacterium]
MEYKNIIYTVKDRVACIKFNRPDQLNAMNTLMMEEIIHALESIRAASTDEVRVALITGNGKAFMAGADIKEYATQTQEEFEAFQTKGQTLYSGIEGNTKPVVAAINGFAFGGGLEIALACDMVVAMEGAKMGLPEVLLNLIPGGGGSLRLAKKIGSNVANEMVMTGRTVLAEELHRLGLISHIYPKDSFMVMTTAFAASIADKEPDRLLAIKQLTQMSAGQVSRAAQNMEFAALSHFYQSKKGQEKIQAFYKKSLEKNKQS